MDKEQIKKELKSVEEQILKTEKLTEEPEFYVNTLTDGTPYITSAALVDGRPVLFSTAIKEDEAELLIKILSGETEEEEEKKFIDEARNEYDSNMAEFFAKQKSELAKELIDLGGGMGRQIGVDDDGNPYVVIVVHDASLGVTTTTHINYIDLLGLGVLPVSEGFIKALAEAWGYSVERMQ